jgi:hypothetical protein
MQLDIGWVLGAIGVLSTTIATLAGVMWGFVKSRLLAQDQIIAAQAVTIAKLQDDIDRVSKGCGHPDCLWGKRIPRLGAITAP